MPQATCRGIQMEGGRVIKRENIYVKKNNRSADLKIMSSGKEFTSVQPATPFTTVAFEASLVPLRRNSMSRVNIFIEAPFWDKNLLKRLDNDFHKVHRNKKRNIQKSFNRHLLPNQVFHIHFVRGPTLCRPSPWKIK